MALQVGISKYHTSILFLSLPCLLFTIKQEDFDKVSGHTDISVIGYITEKGEGVHLLTKGGNKHKLTAQGWNAFG